MKRGRRFPEWFIRSFAIVAVFVGGAYLVWRVGWTMNWPAWWVAVPLLAAEAHGYATYLLYLMMTWDQRPIPRRPIRPGRTVDLFIPTYNEPYEVLALTVAGAVAVEYPHETYVLDDGRREWVCELCEELGARYITRDGNEGAKAGNINHALTVSHGEFIGIMDADFVPSPGYIHDLLPYFEDPKVALVQAPQEFYNTDSFQHADDPEDNWHEQASFYRVIQPGKNRWNAAFWCGSPSMVRRAALEQVGGVATETITEDLHTTLKLHRLGWKTVYHNGVVAKGVAPEDYDAYILQRLRWARGAMQVIRREWRTGGLTFAQRLNYIGSTGTYFDAYRKLVMLIIVPTILVTDTLPIDAPVPLFLGVWVAQFAVMTVANVILGRGHYRYLQTEMFDMLKMFAFVQASLVLLVERSLHFKVTPKGKAGARRLHPFLRPFVVLIGIYVLCIGVGVTRLAEFGLDTHNRPAMVAAVTWGVFILYAILTVTRYGYLHVTRRHVFRFRVDERATVTGTRDRTRLRGRVTDLTLAGASVEVEGALAPGDHVRVCLEEYDIVFEADVRAVRPARREGRAVLGLSITSSNLDLVPLAQLLARRIFTAGRAPQHEAPARQPERVAS